MKTTKISVEIEAGQGRIVLVLENTEGKKLTVESSSPAGEDLLTVPLMHLVSLCLNSKFAELRTGVLALNESARRQTGKLKAFFGPEIFTTLWSSSDPECWEVLFTPQPTLAALVSDAGEV